MAENPPYMNAYGSIGKVLDKIIEAKRPDRFTQDYLETVLALPSSSLRPVIPLLKRIGFLNQDGSPTDVYSKFKTEGGRKAAMAAGLKLAYPDIFKRNEYANKLERSKLVDLVVEMTGLERDNQVIKNVVGTFSALNAYADFDAVEVKGLSDQASTVGEEATKLPSSTAQAAAQQVGMNLAYTINLNLPATTNVEVFNAIFRSLKENMLR